MKLPVTSADFLKWQQSVRAITHDVHLFRNGTEITFDNTLVKRITFDGSTDSGKFFGFVSRQTATIILSNSTALDIRTGDKIVVRLTNAGNTVQYPAYEVESVSANADDNSVTVECSILNIDMYYGNVLTWGTLRSLIQEGAGGEDTFTIKQFTEAFEAIGYNIDVPDASAIANYQTPISYDVFSNTERASSVLRQVAEAAGLFVTYSSNSNASTPARALTLDIRFCSMCVESSIIPYITGADYFNFESGAGVEYKRHDVSDNKILKYLGAEAVQNIDDMFEGNGAIIPYKLEWRGIPYLDIGDHINIDNAMGYMILNERFVYDGGIRATEEVVMSESTTDENDKGSLADVAISGSAADLRGFMDELYKNAAPTSSFAAQTVAIDLSNYRFVVLQARISTSVASVVSCIVAVGQTGRLSWTMSGSYGFRDFTVSKTGIAFTAGTKGSSSNNSYTIPVKVYGIM